MKPAIRLTLLVVLLASLAGAVSADFHDTVFCGDLAAADCALLEASHENEMLQTSGSGVLDLDLILRDVDEDTPGEYSMALDADVVWSGDLSGFEDLAMASPAMMSDPDEMLALLGEMLSQISGSLTLSLQTPQGLPEMEDDAMLQALETGISAEARLVDGVLYVDLASLATITATTDGVPSGWFGFNVMDLLEASMEMDSMADGMKNPRLSDADDQMAASMEELEEMAAAWSDPELLAAFMSVERLTDQIVADRPAAVFRTVVDFEALFDSPEFYDLLMSGATMGDGTGMDEDDLAGLTMMMGMFADSMDVEAITYVSIDDALPLREEMRFAWAMGDMMAMARAKGAGDPYIGVDYRMDYGYPAETPDISVPENAFIISPGLLTSGAMNADA